MTITETEQPSASQEYETDTWITTDQDNTDPEVTGSEELEASQQHGADDMLTTAQETATGSEHEADCITHELHDTASGDTPTVNPRDGSNETVPNLRQSFHEMDTRVNLSDIEGHEGRTKGQTSRSLFVCLFESPRGGLPLLWA